MTVRRGRRQLCFICLNNFLPSESCSEVELKCLGFYISTSTTKQSPRNILVPQLPRTGTMLSSSEISQFENTLAFSCQLQNLGGTKVWLCVTLNNLMLKLTKIMLESKLKEGHVWVSDLVCIFVIEWTYVDRAHAMQALRASYCC